MATTAKIPVSLVIHNLLPDKDEAFSVVLAARNCMSGKEFKVSMHSSDDRSEHYQDNILFPVFLSQGDQSPLYEDLKDGKVRLTLQERAWLSFPGSGEKAVVGKPLTEISIKDMASRKDVQLVCMVFVRTTSSSGSVVFELLAQGEADLNYILKEPTRVAIKDVESQLQGYVEFGGSKGEIAPPYKSRGEKESPEKEISKLQTRWSVTLQSFHSKKDTGSPLSNDQLGSVIFSDFEQIDGERRLPIWAFPALARKSADVTHDGLLTDPAKSIKLLKHWAAIATYLQREIGSSARKVAKQSTAEKEANLLSEFLCLPFRAMIYSPDEVYRGKEEGSKKPKRFLTDQWVQLSNFPASPFICFDCEDGSLLVLQILHWLSAFVKTWKKSDESTKQGWTGSDAEIKALVEIATTSTRYTPFFCLGELQTAVSKSGTPEYSPHAFVVLQPTAVLKRTYQDHGHAFASASGKGIETASEVHFEAETDPETVIPSILVESTSYVDGAWTKDALSDEKAEEIFDQRYEPFLDTDLLTHWGMSGMTPAHFRRALKPKAPVVAVRQHRIYKNLFCAISPFAHKYTNNSTESSRVGRLETFVFPYQTRIDDFMVRKPGLVMRSIHRTTEEEDSTVLQQWLSRYPAGSLVQKLPHKLETIDSLTAHAWRNNLQDETDSLVYVGRFHELKFLGDKDREGNNGTAAAIRKRLVESSHKDFHSMPVEVLRDLRTVVVGTARE